MLSELEIQNLEPRLNVYKKYDEEGLYICVPPSGRKWWRFRYFFDGREKGLSLGVHPEVSLARAREERDRFLSFLASGIDPSDIRKQDRLDAPKKVKPMNTKERKALIELIESSVFSSKSITFYLERLADALRFKPDTQEEMENIMDDIFEQIPKAMRNINIVVDLFTDKEDMARSE